MKIFEWLLGTQELAGQTGWNFGFLADYEPWLKFLLFLVLAFLVYLTIRSYRREGDTKPSVKAILAGLRIAVIVVIIAILFRPAIVLKLVKTLHSVVIVLNDTSQSASFTDPYPDVKTQKQLCDYLGVTPAELEARSRLDNYREVLLRKNGVLAVMAKDHILKPFRFSTTQPGKEPYTVQMGTYDMIRADGDTTPFTGELPAGLVAEYRKLKGDGYQTNLAEGIRNALDATQGQRLQALVILSDGQPTTEDADNRLLAAMEYARQRGVPIYTIMVGDPTPPKDVKVVSVQGPREARKGSEVEFAVMVRQLNYDGQPATVRLQRQKVGEKNPENWTEIDKQTLRLQAVTDAGSAGTRGVQTVKFKTKPEGSEAGLNEVRKATEYRYRAYAYVGPELDKKEIPKKSAETLVRIVDSKINVLLISGDTGWEFQYLRNLLQRQGDLYRVSVWQQNAELEVSQAASSEDLRLTQMPYDLSDLMGDPEHKDPKRPGYQAIIIYDPQRTKCDPKTGKGGFDEKFVDNLELFVKDHRGGLCYIAGNKYTDDNLLSANAAFKKLQAMLPVELSINRQDITSIMSDKPPEAWRALVTSYGQDHQITRQAETAEASYKVWSELPGIYWSHSVSRIKPAARVLLENENPSRQTIKGEREPLVALHMYGSGPVIYVGTDDTWRWRCLEDAKFHKRFWNNIVGFLATLEASRVIITTGGDSFNVGERIKVEAVAYDEKYRPLTDAALTVEVLETNASDKTEGPKNETLKLNKIEGKDGHYRGIYVGSRKGSFEITVKGVPGVEAKRIAIKVPEVEAIHSEANEGVMRSLVNRESDFLRLWEVDKLKEMIPSGKLTSNQESPQELWDKQLLLWVLVTLLAIEWILRKKFNMA